MRRLATIAGGGFIGASVAVFGSMAFFTYVDPHPRVATQDAMGYGLLIEFVIIPACTVAGAMLVARLTKPK